MELELSQCIITWREESDSPKSLPPKFPRCPACLLSIGKLPIQALYSHHRTFEVFQFVEAVFSRPFTTTRGPQAVSEVGFFLNGSFELLEQKNILTKRQALKHRFKPDLQCGFYFIDSTLLGIEFIEFWSLWLNSFCCAFTGSRMQFEKLNFKRSLAHC